MSRATDADVQAIIKLHSSVDTAVAIRTAGGLVDWVNSKCDTAGVLTSSQLKDMETWLAAHFASFLYQQYKEKATGDAKAVFQGETNMGLEATMWGQQALAIDITGCLRSRVSGGGVKMEWLGKAPSNQTDYADRD